MVNRSTLTIGNSKRLGIFGIGFAKTLIAVSLTHSPLYQCYNNTRLPYHARMRIDAEPNQKMAEQSHALLSKVLAPYIVNRIAQPYTKQADGSLKLIPSNRCNEFTKQQFQEMFARIFKEKLPEYHTTLLNMHDYYKHSGFIEAIREFSEYEDYIINLHNQAAGSWKSTIDLWWQGLPLSQLRQLNYDAVLSKTQRQRDQQAKQRSEQLERQKLAEKLKQERLKNELTARLEEQKETLILLNDSYQEAEGCGQLTIHQQKRLETVKQFLNNPGTRFFIHHYRFNEDAIQLLTAQGFSEKRIESLTKNFGNRIQHASYQECIDIINELGTIKGLMRQATLTPLETATLETALLGCQASKAGYIHQAYSLADFGWASLECIKGVAEGIYDGVINTSNIFLHPIETAHHIVETIKTAGIALGKALFYISSANADAELLSMLYFNTSGTPEQRAERERMIDTLVKRNQDRAAYIEATIATIEQKLAQTSKRDLIRKTTGIITETYLTGKSLEIFHQFFTAARLHAIEFAEQVKAGEKIAVSTEGIAVEVANEAANTFLKMEKEGEKVIYVKHVEEIVNQSSVAIFKNGYYEVNGFKFTEYYYNRLWDQGRKAPSLAAQAILENADTVILPDPKGIDGFFKYVSDGWEMIYNPATKIVSHIQQVRK